MKCLIVLMLLAGCTARDTNQFTPTPGIVRDYAPGIVMEITPEATPPPLPPRTWVCPVGHIPNYDNPRLPPCLFISATLPPDMRPPAP